MKTGKRAPRDSDLLNRRFERLLVIECAGRSGGRVIWLCLCDCGNKIVARHNNLRSGNTKSCGCKQTRHGHAGAKGSPTYVSWQNMIARVNGQRGAETAKNYSDRGIGVCSRWRVFDLFLEDMGIRPIGSTLDRIDNDRGYECGICETCVDTGRKMNCRWATRKQQQRNRRTNVLLTLDGETACLSEWAERTGIRFNRLRIRLKSGWSTERALTTPVKGTTT